MCRAEFDCTENDLTVFLHTVNAKNLRFDTLQQKARDGPLLSNVNIIMMDHVFVQRNYLALR